MWPARHRVDGRGGGVAALAALAVIVVGCSGSQRERVKEELESLHSWAVSSRMVGERWLHGAVPDPYASETLSSFAKKVEKEREKAASGKLPAQMKKFLVAEFDSTALATDSLLALVDRRERRAAAGVLARLSRQARAADSVKERVGTK